MGEKKFLDINDNGVVETWESLVPVVIVFVVASFIKVWMSRH